MAKKQSLLRVTDNRDYHTVSPILKKNDSLEAVTKVLNYVCERGDDRLVKIAVQNTTKSIVCFNDS